MAELRPCKSIEDVNQMLAESNNKIVLLLKHSTVCPISSNAYSEVAKFAPNTPGTPVWIVLVRESRPISMHLAEITGVTHQSPQAILIKNGKAVWDASHYKISAATLQKAVEENSEK